MPNVIMGARLILRSGRRCNYFEIAGAQVPLFILSFSNLDLWLCGWQK